MAKLTDILNSPALLSHSHDGDQSYYVEVHVETNSALADYDLQVMVKEYLKKKKMHLYDGGIYYKNQLSGSLKQHVVKLTFGGCSTAMKRYQAENVQIFLYRLYNEGPIVEQLDSGSCEDGDGVAASNHWILPNLEFDNLWPSLQFECDVKENLLKYMKSILLFSDRDVDSSLIICNRMILFHGPPGTGKTTLCKAFAQKLCIRFSHRYKYGQLIEINSHSLFSKWFSESGKLVLKMFQKINELIDDEESLVLVLIDEVESLTVARRAAMAGNEPNDAVRVVNALLTQIDQLRRRKNVLLLTTSNISDAIDPAFIDRADICHYVGLPSAKVSYAILCSCVRELIRVGIIESDSTPFLDPDQLANIAASDSLSADSLNLFAIAKLSHGMSGRSLRKLPILAHSKLCDRQKVTLPEFLSALRSAMQSHVNTLS